MKVAELGESGLIELLTRLVTQKRSRPDIARAHEFRLLVGPGDDAAAWRPGLGTELYTTDTVVEHVHFTRTTTPWADLGWKLMAANVSDIAAMGGLPLYALITLGLPPETEIEELESLYGGVLDLGDRFGVAIVGGDIVRSPVVFATVGLTGVAEREPMLRSNANPGDQIAVTGYLGSSAGGLKLMCEELPVHGKAAEYLKAAHRRPEPRVSHGQMLSQNGVRTAMDISDGLLEDLSKLCRSSQVSAILEADRIPVHPLLRETFPDNCLEMALGGGEDYELIFAAPEELMSRILQVLPAPVGIVGEIAAGTAGQVLLVDSRTERRLETPSGGWDHFR